MCLQNLLRYSLYRYQYRARNFKPVDREISGKFGKLTCDDDQLTVQTESKYLIEEDLRTKNGIERQGESVTRTREKKIKQTFDKASWGNKNNVSSLRNLLWCCGMLSMTPRRDNILAKHFPLGRQSLTENEFFTQRWGKTSYACDQCDLHGAWIDLKSRINPAKYKKQKDRLSYQLLSTYPDKCNTRRTCTSGRTRGPLASLRSDIPL